jgi:SAM-dependent methyltransferase
MGLIFDIRSATLYDAWCHSPQGRAMERLAEKFIISLLDPQPGERVLDVGCGTGNHLLFLSKLGLDITGIDASPYMISRARERLGKRCALKTGIAEDLPFDDNEFDLAVLTNTLEFLDDPLPALREAGRVANRGVFIGVMNSFSWYCLFNKLQGLFRESLLNHVRFYNMWALKSHVRVAFGQIPIVWGSAPIWPPSLNRIEEIITDQWSLNHLPFGSFLGLAATVIYRMKTDSLPLKVRMSKARQSIARGLTLGNKSREGGVRGDERGLSL